MIERIDRSKAEWRTLLSPEQYHVLREKGTERPYTGRYYDNKRRGIYHCAGCGLELFSSEAKYESGTGWPSFYAPLDSRHLRIEDDYTFFMRRTEVLCARCGGHLGHVFSDGPRPTGQRFCMNSTALDFVEARGERVARD